MKKIGKILAIMSMVGILLMANIMEIHAEEYEYDMLNRVKKVIYEDGSYVEYEYDKNGNIVDIKVYESLSEEEYKPEEEEKPSEEGDDTTEESKPEEEEKPSEEGDDTTEESKPEEEEKPSEEGDDTTEESKP
ncbi:MAG: RHS repeat protein, partial [Lachnospiraceae bacterium]|nr:RHS repeat protein [Lachnospiraceae bacterium]